MVSYKYEIVGPDGKPKSGTIESQNIEMATAELKAGGNRTGQCVQQRYGDPYRQGGKRPGIERLLPSV